MARVVLLSSEDEGPEGALERAEWVGVGTVFLGLSAPDLGRLWNRARMRGARRVVLEVSQQEDTEYTQVKVLERS